MDNNVSGERLLAFVERIERIRLDRRALAEDERVVMAECKAAGFVPSIVTRVVKLRAMKPSDLQEIDVLTDLYMSALGMAAEPPLFRAAGLISVDIAARESVIEVLKRFVPANGSIVIEADGKPVRLTRDKDGHVAAVNVQPERVAADPAPAKPAARTKADVPNCSADEAEELGRTAAKDDKAIIMNPFPFGDARRPCWDLGWRKQTGNDGMGPS